MKGTLKKLLIVLIAVSMVILPTATSWAYADETTGEAASDETADDVLLSSFDVPKLGEDAAAELLASEEKGTSVSGVITREELDLMSEEELNETVRVSIVLSNAPVLGKYGASKVNSSAARNYRQTLRNQQASLEGRINKALGKKIEVKWNLTLAVNVISAEVTYRDIKTILGVSGVESVQRENRYVALTDDAGTAEPNTSLTSEHMVGAQTAWAEGYTGAGMRIAIIDTGADIDHQSFDAGAFEYALDKYEEKFGKTPDLLEESEVTAAAADLNGQGVYLNSKMPYIYNYVDENTNVTHLYDTEGEHGSHVAGIAAANRYIPDGDSYVDTLDGTYAVGMAPDAQILVMKVFGQNGGANDSDYMAAIEDAIVLGCASCNLSLGTATSGFTYDTVYQGALNYLSQTGTVAAISAGNSYDWGSTNSPYGVLYADSVSFDTVGSPGSYINAFTVAAANNVGSTGAPLEFGSEKVFYTETSSSGAAMKTLDTTADGTGTEYSFVYIDARGYAEEYAAVNAAIALKGKIVLINRGAISFVEKGNNVIQYQPAAAVVVNSTNGSISMGLDNYTGSFPFVSVNGEDRPYIVSTADGTTQVSASVTYDFNEDGEITDDEKNVAETFTVYTGKVAVTGATATEVSTEREDATITDFSSWGVPGSLILKPEITAPGGNIYSVNGTAATQTGMSGGTDQYELMSGTSMAAPHIAGLSALIEQYLIENGDLAEGNSELVSDYSRRAIAQSLMMSTATPMQQNEAYMSVFQQGAGLVDISKAIGATSVVMIDEAPLTVATGAAADGKVKVELGDDPAREGVYNYSFTIYNTTDEDETFELDSDFFTQDLYYYDTFHDTYTKGIDVTTAYSWSATPAIDGQDAHDVDKDGDTDGDDAQAILDYLTGVRDGSDLDLTVGDMDEDGEITTYDAHLILAWRVGEGYATNYVVPANGKAQVTVTVTVNEDLSAYPVGAYIEGFTYANCVSETEEGLSLETSHSIPVLGFYGDWTESSMFDYTSMVDLIYYGEDEVWPSYSGNYSNCFLMKQGSDEFIFTGNPYVPEEEFPYDRLAITSDTEIEKVYYNLIRNAATTGYAVSALDADGEIDEVLEADVKSIQVYGLYTDTQGNKQNTGIKNCAVGKTPADYGLAEGDAFRAGFYAVTEYTAMQYTSALGDGTMTSDENGYLDTDEELADVIEQGLLGDGAYIGYDFIVDDTAPELISVDYDAAAGTVAIKAEDNENIAFVGLLSLDGEVFYDYEVPADAEADCTLDISEVMNDIPRYAAVVVADYAGNETIQLLQVNDNDPEFEDPTKPAAIVLSTENMYLYKGNSEVVTAKVIPITAENTDIVWTTSDSGIADVSGGTITGVAAGVAVITATSAVDDTVKAECTVNVISVDAELGAVAWDYKIPGNDNESIIKIDTTDASAIKNYTCLGDKKGLATTSAYYGLKSGAQLNPTVLYVGTLDYSSGDSEVFALDANYNFVDSDSSTEELDPYGTGYVTIVDMALGYPAASSGMDMAYVYGPYFILGNSDPSLGVYANMPGTVGIPYGVLVEHPNYESDETYFCAVALKSIHLRDDVNPEYYLLDETGMLWDATSVWGKDADGYDELQFTLTEMFNIGIEPNWLRQSLFYDDTTKSLFYACTEAGEGATLYYIDVANERVVEMGDFGDDVWPVTGLFGNPRSGVYSAPALPDHFNPNMEAVSANMAEVEAFRAKLASQSADGALHSAEDEVSETEGTVDTEAVAADDNLYPHYDLDNGTVTYYDELFLYELEESTNGFATVKYDPEVLTYAGAEAVIDHTSVFVDEENGLIKFAYADENAIEAGQPLEVLTFMLNAPCTGSDVTVTTTERNDDLDLEEVTQMETLAAHAWGEWEYDKETETFSHKCDLCGLEETEPFPHRIFGASRFDTAIEIAEAYKELTGTEKFETIVVATGTEFPDALTGSYLSIEYDAPMLLVNKQDAVMQKVIDYIDANAEEAAKIYILGGTGVVDEGFETKLTSKGYDVTRLAGSNRYNTNLAILGESEDPGSELLVCSGLNWPDAATASATGLPILIVSKTLNDAQKAYLAEQNFTDIYVIGGTGVVGEDVLTSLKPYAENVTRVAGNNRAATAIAVAEEFYPEELHNLVFAYRNNFPDCISGGLLANALGAPILYGPDYLDINTAFVEKCGAWEAYALGGKTLVTTDFFLTTFAEMLSIRYDYE